MIRTVRSAAFTLIELLVVILIIAILAGMLMTAVNMVLERARITKTELRMQDLRSMFKQTAEEHRSPVGWYQQQAGLGGVVEFRGKDFKIQDTYGNWELWTDLDNHDYGYDYVDGWNYGSPYEGWDTYYYGYLWATKWRISHPVPKTGSWFTEQDYADQPHLFAFPWPETDKIYATARPPRQAHTNHSTGEPVTYPLVCQDADDLDDEGYQTASLSGLSPVKTLRLMIAAGLFERQGVDPSRYFTDRGDDRPWNDAWGSPLVVAYGLFQPPDSGYVGAPYIGNHSQIDGKGVERLDGWRVTEARKRYGYSRALYLAFAAPGPVLPRQLPGGARTEDDPLVWEADIWPTLWDEITTSCEGGAWTGATFTDTRAREPWGGFRTESRDGYRHLLSAPVDIRGF